MEVGDVVKIKPPFDTTYAGEYILSKIEKSVDGQLVHFVDGIEGGFSEIYLEKI